MLILIIAKLSVRVGQKATGLQKRSPGCIKKAIDGYLLYMNIRPNTILCIKGIK